MYITAFYLVLNLVLYGHYTPSNGIFFVLMQPVRIFFSYSISSVWASRASPTLTPSDNFPQSASFCTIIHLGASYDSVCSMFFGVIPVCVSIVAVSTCYPPECISTISYNVILPWCLLHLQVT